MITIPNENMTPSVIDHAVLDDPELIRQRKEARRNMTAARRQELLDQAAERADEACHEKFKQECFEHTCKR